MLERQRRNKRRRRNGVCTVFEVFVGDDDRFLAMLRIIESHNIENSEM